MAGDVPYFVLMFRFFAGWYSEKLRAQHHDLYYTNYYACKFMRNGFNDAFGGHARLPDKRCCQGY
jgi:hypothetical protein